MTRRFVLRIGVLRNDYLPTRIRADRGDFTPPGFAAVAPAEVAGDCIELHVEVADEEEARRWSIGPRGQLRRDTPSPPPPPSVVR